MVMDAQPSPQNVGREFVRQYYTLLNKAPDHLHRFYNNSSSFLHGGLDAKSLEATLVIGQKQIHSKIQQLNFRDCHAKISQVDSQATLGNGVVVQVIGELSNDGQPMRRFTQTFVLAAQSPKKYYVHNDIFRYQDVYSDDELDDGGERANGEEEAVHQLVNDAADTALVLGEPKIVGTTTNNVASSLVNVGVHAHPQAQAQSTHSTQNAQQQPQLYYPSNVINSSSVVLPSAYGIPSASQTQAAPQQQHLNGLHDNMLKNVPGSDSGSPATGSLLSSTSSEHANVGNASSVLKAVVDQTGVGVPPHISQTNVTSQHQQQLQSLTQTQATTVQLGLTQQQQQQQNRHQLSTLTDSNTIKSSLNSNDLNSSSAMAGSVSSSHVDTAAAALQNSSLLDRNAADLDKQQQQQHKSLQHQQLHSHSQQQQPQQQHQKPHTTVGGSGGFGKQQQQTPVSLEPKTYANLVKSGVSASSPLSFASAMQTSLNTHNQTQPGLQISGGGNNHSQQQQQPQHQNYNASAVAGNNRQQRDMLSPPPTVPASSAANGGGLGASVVGVSSKYASDRQDDRDRIGTGLSGSGTGMSQQRSQQQRSLRSNGSNSNSLGGTGGGSLRQQESRQSSYSRQNYDSDERRQGSSSQFGDNHQLFLGNIPHHATEEELKTLFSKFGTVVDLRILSKSVQKMPGVRTPPHYGFITYEDPSSVQTCLANMPLFFPENSPDGQKLNVEEKKTRIRGPGEGSGRINNNGGGLGGSSANTNGPRSGGNSTGQSRPSGGQGGAGSNRGNSGGSGQRSIAGGNVGGGSSGNRGSGGSGGYGQRSDRGNVGNAQRSLGNGGTISNRGFGSGY
uniref:NTF2 domain-containing protein n=1 Tax=Anopheles atroparvus TaxID=41427 RepID=A0AAG5DVS8_ANOAO